MGDLALRLAHGPRRQQLTVGTLNVGKAPAGEVVKVARECDALALQEMSDGADIVKALREDGFRIVSGPEGTGQPATPLAYDPATLELHAPIRELLLPRKFVGPGAGPAWSKPKWFVGARFVHKPTGRLVVYGSVHNLASQYLPLRRRYAMTFSTALVKVLNDRAAITLVGGDFNAQPTDATLAPLRDAGWTCNHMEGKKRGTHGRRAIDGVWWRRNDKRIRFDRHQVRATRSDHDAVIVTFDIKEK